jgi:hypothetical protein
LLCCRCRGRRCRRRHPVHCGHRRRLAVVDCCFVLVPADAIIFIVITIVVVAIVVFVFNSCIITMFIPVVIVAVVVVVAGAVRSIVAIVVVVDIVLIALAKNSTPLRRSTPRTRPFLSYPPPKPQIVAIS